MAFTIREMTTRERLHRLVDGLSEQEAQRARIVVEDERTAEQRRRENDEATVAGYTRYPAEKPDATVRLLAEHSIREEPW
jgi:hypothetical protein